MILILGGIAACVLALVLQSMWPNGFPLSTKHKEAGAVKEISEIHASGSFRINEIMSADRYSAMTEDNDSADWIEIINAGSNAQDIGGYQLSKTDGSVGVFTFPSMTLQPNECVLVFADSKLRAEAGQELHAPFRLSASGDTLMLFNASGTAVDTVNIPALGKDISYARQDTAKWTVCEEPTPGAANTHENYVAMTQVAGNSPIVLNELVARNKTVLADENGQYNDYVELYNRSGDAVNLKGWYISDNEANPRRWRFPEVTIGPGEYLIVFASGLDKTDDPAHLHTNFGLSSEGEHVILSDASGRRMDEVTIGLMKQDVAYARGADGSWSMGTPTPGSANG